MTVYGQQHGRMCVKSQRGCGVSTLTLALWLTPPMTDNEIWNKILKFLRHGKQTWNIEWQGHTGGGKKHIIKNKKIFFFFINYTRIKRSKAAVDTKLYSIRHLKAQREIQWHLVVRCGQSSICSYKLHQVCQTTAETQWSNILASMRRTWVNIHINIILTVGLR